MRPDSKTKARRMSIPVILLTGFLGSGKTTLLNHLLRQPAWLERHPALVINEFGSLGVDGHLVASGDLPKYEVNAGSVFCACTQAQVLAALGQIAGDRRTGLVLIEATGVAETGDLEAYFDQPTLFGQFAIRANVCVVDALNFAQVAAHLSSVQHQVRHADGLVINKVDLVVPEQRAQLADLLAGLNPRAPQCQVAHGAVDAEFLAGLSHRRVGRAIDEAPAEVVAATIRSDRPLSRLQFEAAVRRLGPRLLRLKGHVDFGQGSRFVELVGDRMVERAPCPGLPDGTVFSAIGWQIGRDAIVQAFVGGEVACEGTETTSGGRDAS